MVTEKKKGEREKRGRERSLGGWRSFPLPGEVVSSGQRRDIFWSREEIFRGALERAARRGS